MLDRITELIKESGISIHSLTAINEGASGAHVLNADDKFIIKYAVLSELDATIRMQFHNEIHFYREWSNAEIDFIPEVVYHLVNSDEILIIMKKYAGIRCDEWDHHLLKCAMRLCARINATHITGCEALFDALRENDIYSLSDSYKNWCCLQEKFPNHIAASMLTAMYEHHNKIVLFAENLAIPKTLCHGDFHPNNFLINNDELIICDWQNVNIGRGIGDVSFFISRGVDMGLRIDRDMLIRQYCEAFHKHTKKRVEIDDLYTYIAVSEFSISFKFWAKYLQNSNIDRVMNIYDSMVNAYTFACSKQAHV